MIGINKNSNYKSTEYEFAQDYRLYVFTDGIFEEFNSKEEEFGETGYFSGKFC